MNLLQYRGEGFVLSFFSIKTRKPGIFIENTPKSIFQNLVGDGDQYAEKRVKMVSSKNSEKTKVSNCLCDQPRFHFTARCSVTRIPEEHLTCQREDPFRYVFCSVKS